MFLCSRRPAARLPVVPCLRQSFRRCTLPFLACAVVAASDPAASQTAAPGPTRLEPIAVTASRQSQPIADVLADLTVIGPEEIARAGVMSLTELLQRQPGVEIVQNGGPGSVSGVFLRGANRGQTLVLIDGVRMSSSSAGATTLEAIPLDQIERIEVLRGPASSLYGADAIGGVIQVFTRQGGGAVSGNASAGYGTFNTWDVKGGVAGSAGPVTFAVQAAAKESNGFNTITNPANFLLQPRHRRLHQPERVGERRRHVRARPGSAGAVFPQPAEQPVRRQRDFRRPHDHDGRDVASAKPQPARELLGLAALGGAGHRRQPDADGRWHLAVQDHAAPVHVAERVRAAAGRAHRRLRAARGAPGDRPRVRDHVARHRFGVRPLSAARRCPGGAGQPAPRRVEPIRRADDRRDRVQLPSLAARGGSPRATAPASRRRRSTISTSRSSPIRILRRRPRATSKAASTGTVPWRERPSKPG